MDWTCVLGIVLGNAAWVLPMFFWIRSEANADRRAIQATLDAIKDEMKDFHARLCVIEERRNKFLFKE